MCLFGDRLYTDIALGARNGVTSVLVLTGETQLEDLEKAGADEQPTFVFGSLDDVDHAMFG
jgi:ribonucleotide monophosphatase NagD (HAD superfamily)